MVVDRLHGLLAIVLLFLFFRKSLSRISTFIGEVKGRTPQSQLALGVRPEERRASVNTRNSSIRPSWC